MSTTKLVSKDANDDAAIDAFLKMKGRVDGAIDPDDSLVGGERGLTHWIFYGVYRVEEKVPICKYGYTSMKVLIDWALSELWIGGILLVLTVLLFILMGPRRTQVHSQPIDIPLG